MVLVSYLPFDIHRFWKYYYELMCIKECPTCAATIEKDGGCNHVICKNSSCKAEFCWVCLGPWEPHGSSWYNCNR